MIVRFPVSMVVSAGDSTLTAHNVPCAAASAVGRPDSGTTSDGLPVAALTAATEFGARSSAGARAALSPLPSCETTAATTATPSAAPPAIKSASARRRGRSPAGAAAGGRGACRGAGGGASSLLCSRIWRSSSRSAGAGLDSQLVDECGAAGAICLQRLRLAAAAVEREHQLPSKAFAERVLAHERLELPTRSAWRPSARSASIRASSATRRSSSRRAMSLCANGS